MIVLPVAVNTPYRSRSRGTGCCCRAKPGLP